MPNINCLCKWVWHGEANTLAYGVGDPLELRFQDSGRAPGEGCSAHPSRAVCRVVIPTLLSASHIQFVEAFAQFPFALSVLGSEERQCPCPLLWVVMA